MFICSGQFRALVYVGSERKNRKTAQRLNVNFGIDQGALENSGKVVYVPLLRGLLNLLSPLFYTCVLKNVQFKVIS